MHGQLDQRPPSPPPHLPASPPAHLSSLLTSNPNPIQAYCKLGFSEAQRTELYAMLPLTLTLTLNPNP